MSIRSDWVFRYRRELLNRICAAAIIDIHCQCVWTWRYEAYNRVPHWKMILFFWRRISSFYPNQSFADPTIRGPRMQCVEELIKDEH